MVLRGMAEYRDKAAGKAIAEGLRDIIRYMQRDENSMDGGICAEWITEQMTEQAAEHITEQAAEQATEWAAEQIREQLKTCRRRNRCSSRKHIIKAVHPGDG